jgi:hypothetical protein
MAGRLPQSAPRNHSKNVSCKAEKTSRTNSTFGFLPTHKPKLKNQKSYFLANA